MAVFLIDGDDAPGTRTKGLYCLASEDMVCICYAKTNKYDQNVIIDMFDEEKGNQL